MDASHCLQELVHQFNPVPESPDEWLHFTNVQEHTQVKEIQTQYLKNGIAFENDSNENKCAPSYDEYEIIRQVSFIFQIDLLYQRTKF